MPADEQRKRKLDPMRRRRLSRSESAASMDMRAFARSAARTFARKVAITGAMAIAATAGHAQPCAPGSTLRDVELLNVSLLDAAATLEALKRRFALVPGACITPRLDIDIAEELKRLYAAAGYGAIRIDLPSLSEQGRMSIRVVEGRLTGRPEVKHAQYHTESNVVASLPALMPGQPLRIYDLDAQLRLANENPSKELQVLLKPSEGVDGEIRAELRLRGSPIRDLRLALDNTGSSSTRHRIAATWRHANATGRDDVLTLQYQTSPEEPGSIRTISAGYRIPFYARALALELYATGSSVEGRHATAAGDLTLNGEGQLIGAKASWLIRRCSSLSRSPSTPNRATRAAASSIANGMPSSRRQTSATAA